MTRFTKGHDPTIGEVLFYRLSESDVSRIRRQAAHHTHHEGQTIPLIVVRVYENEYGDGIPGVNGQAILDNELGNLWIMSAKEGEKPGQWTIYDTSVDEL